MTAMVKYEIKKVFARKGGVIALLIMLVLTAYTCWFATNGSSSEWVNENGDTERGYQAMVKKREAQRAWSGILDEEKIRQVIEENLRITSTPEYNSKDVRLSNIAFGWGQGIHEIRGLLNHYFAEDFQTSDYYRANSLTPDMAGDFYPNRVRLLKEFLADETNGSYYRFSDAEKDWIIRQYEALETPFYVDYMQGWDNALTYYPTISMILIMVLGYLMAGIFSNEFQWKSDSIFFASTYGRNSAIRAKLAAGFLIVTAIYWAAILVYSLTVLGYLGFYGASCPLQASGRWKSFYNLTNAQAYLIVILGGYIGCVFIAFLTMLISACSRSTVLGVMTPVIIIFLPNFIQNMSFDAVIIDKLLALLPARLLELNMELVYFDLFDFGGFVTGALPVVIALYVFLSAALPPVIYREYRRKEIM